jgi:hypothetical protein
MHSMAKIATAAMSARVIGARLLRRREQREAKS